MPSILSDHNCEGQARTIFQELDRLAIRHCLIFISLCSQMSDWKQMPVMSWCGRPVNHTAAYCSPAVAIHLTVTNRWK